VHNDVHVGEPSRERWITDVDNPPGDTADVAPALIDCYDPPYQVGRRQLRSQGLAEAASRPGDRDNRSPRRVTSAALRANLGYSVAHYGSLLG
jgi:hypothetical protein